MVNTYNYDKEELEIINNAVCAILQGDTNTMKTELDKLSPLAIIYFESSLELIRYECKSLIYKKV
jgi:hypothetical protein